MLKMNMPVLIFNTTVAMTHTKYWYLNESKLIQGYLLLRMAGLSWDRTGPKLDEGKED